MAEIGEDCNRYEIREKYRKEWDKLYPEKEVYTKTKEMITNISVNSVVTRPYGYEIIEVMQFTWLLDKNGKEIFEGDIVGVKELRWIVNLGWSDDGEYGVCQKTNYGNYIFRDVDKVPERYEIIGNIYENSEEEEMSEWIKLNKKQDIYFNDK